MKVAFVARALDVGGAERQLTLLARELRSRGVDVSIVVFYDDRGDAARQAAGDVPVVCLDKNGRWELLRFYGRLVAHLRASNADVVCSYLTGPNLFAALAKPFMRGTALVWGVRATRLDLACYDWTLAWLTRIEGALSRVADLVICNSQAGREDAIVAGFPSERTVVVANGIDTARFRPDPAGREAVRAAWSVPRAAPLVGLVARFDPMKDHATFVDAAAIVATAEPEARFACVGDGSPAHRQALKQRVRTLGLDDRFIFAGAREDMPAVYSALDVSCSASAFGEGFSNALAESMSCGVPCVATDVGDAATIVGDIGRIVPTRDPGALAKALLEVLADRRREPTLGDRARERIERSFGVAAMVDRTLAHFSVASARRDPLRGRRRKPAT